MKLYWRVIKYIKPHWKHVLAGIFFTILFVFFNAVSVWVSADFLRELFMPQKDTAVLQEGEPAQETESREEWVVNQLGKQRIYIKMKEGMQSIIVRENKFETLKVVCIVLFLAFFLKNFSTVMQRIFFYFVQLKIVVRLRNELQRSMLRLPLSFYHKEHTGNLTSVAFNDVNRIQTVLNSSFVKIFLAPLQVLVYLVVLLLISWKLTLATFAIIPISGYLIIKIGQSMRRKSTRVLEQISIVLKSFQESISSIRIVKAFTTEEKEIEKFARINESFFKKSFRAQRLDALTSPLNETIGVFIFAILLWYGGVMVFKGQGIDAEDFFRFLAFLFLMFQPLKELSGLNNILQSGLAAADRVFSIMDTPAEIYEKPDAKEMKRFSDGIVFKNVDFQYKDGPAVLQSINLTINKGEMVAFVGHSGVGKSTLVDLIPRFYTIEKGQITIDGVDIRDLTLTSLRDQIGLVTQETILFNDTVRENIAYGGDGYTDDALIEAARNANAWEFIEQMEEGLDTIIGERGVTLSGGQRQRISIARAILKNTPILILDEATSALDTQSEKLVQRAIDNLMQNRTVLVIAHRLSTILHADKIVVMEKGHIVNVGKHEELLKQSRVYEQLYTMQFRDGK